jgi:hypothetical protein
MGYLSEDYDGRAKRCLGLAGGLGIKKEPVLQEVDCANSRSMGYRYEGMSLPVEC